MWVFLYGAILRGSPPAAGDPGPFCLVLSFLPGSGSQASVCIGRQMAMADGWVPLAGVRI